MTTDDKKKGGFDLMNWFFVLFWGIVVFYLYNNTTGCNPLKWGRGSGESSEDSFDDFGPR